MQIILYSVIRITIGYLVLLTITRLVGRKSISQMTFFDFAISITFGSVTANIGMDNRNTFVSGITILITLGVLGIMTGYLHISSMSFRKLVNSEPVTLIDNGEIVKKNMRKLRFTINELTALLREKNYFNISDVNYAILETDGKLSVLPKAAKRPLTPCDLQIESTETGLTKDIIIDGKIQYENLKYTKYTDQWLLNELQNKGIGNIIDVLYAAVDFNGNLYVTKGYKINENQGEYGIE